MRNCFQLSCYIHLLMKKSSLWLCAVSFCMLTAVSVAEELPAFSQSTQIVVVTTTDWKSSQATLQRYERATAGKRWKAVGEPFTVVVGKTGLGWGSGLIAVD